MYQAPIAFPSPEGITESRDGEDCGKESHRSGDKAFGREQVEATCKEINISTFPSSNPSSKFLGLAID